MRFVIKRGSGMKKLLVILIDIDLKQNNFIYPYTFLGVVRFVCRLV